MNNNRLFAPFLLAILAAACNGAIPAAIDADSDADGDGINDAVDRCAETVDAAWVDSEGCAEAQDGDSDGLATDRDHCPGTPAGVPVDGNGCSEEQREAPAPTESSDTPAPKSGDVGEWTPSDDGSVSPNGFSTFVLDPEGAFPVVLRTLENNVTRRQGGFDLKGTVMMDVPGGEPITLLDAEVALDYGSGEGAGLESFRGAVRLPFPNIGYAKNAKVADLVHAAVGYDYGRNVSDVSVPLDGDRKYFYFTFSAGLEAEIGDLKVETTVNQSATMALDPSDPAFFLEASLGGLMGPVDEASVGFSIGGHLQFEPENSWGIDEEAASFEGHFWIGGTVNLISLGIPVAVGGSTVYDFDPNDDGVSFFEQPEDGFQFGTNAELDLAIEAGFIALSIPVADATLVGRAGESGAKAYYSGLVRAGDWLPVELPLSASAQLKTAGHASSNVEESYFHAEGMMNFDGAALGDMTGLDVDDLAVANAKLDIDRSGVLVSGTVSGGFSPYVGLSGKVVTEGFFNGKPEDWFVSLEGRLAVSGIDLSSNAYAVLNHEGMFVQGVFSTPLGGIDMSGKISAQGVDLRGHAEVTIPIVAGKEELQWITDEVVCGTEMVVDGALCGTEIVEDGVLCGVDHVTSGTLCGMDYVTDGAVCGWSYGQNAAMCGSSYVTSGVLCGVSYFSDIWHCGTSCILGDCSCSFDNSCWVDNSCSWENSCAIEASCDLPKTCEVDLSCERAKTCETRVVIPDFDYGTFKGTVEVAIGTSGLGGGVQGEYCATGDSCVPLGGGRVQVVNGRTEACVTVPGLGEFCAGF